MFTYGPGGLPHRFNMIPYSGKTCDVCDLSGGVKQIGGLSVSVPEGERVGHFKGAHGAGDAMAWASQILANASVLAQLPITSGKISISSYASAVRDVFVANMSYSQRSPSGPDYIDVELTLWTVGLRPNPACPSECASCHFPTGGGCVPGGGGGGSGPNMTGPCRHGDEGIWIMRSAGFPYQNSRKVNVTTVVLLAKLDGNDLPLFLNSSAGPTGTDTTTMALRLPAGRSVSVVVFVGFGQGVHAPVDLPLQTWRQSQEPLYQGLLWQEHVRWWSEVGRGRPARLPCILSCHPATVRFAVLGQGLAVPYHRQRHHGLVYPQVPAPFCACRVLVGSPAGPPLLPMVCGPQVYYYGTTMWYYYVLLCIYGPQVLLWCSVRPGHDLEPRLCSPRALWPVHHH